MLMDLRVTNFAIINSLSLSFGDGLNILSGETGAGKSVLLKSLGLLMGAKSDTETVRQGAEQAVVEGLFDLTHRPDIRTRLEDMGIPLDDDALVVRRLLSAEGKSKVYLNGNLSPLAMLKDLVAPLITVTGHAAPLIEMTGQHDSRHLQSPGYHLDLIDQFIEAGEEREIYGSLYNRQLELRRELKSLEDEQRTRDQRVDFLKFQIDEIKQAGLAPGEDEALLSRVQRLRHSARLAEFASMAEDSLYDAEDSVSRRLYSVIQKAQELKRYDESLEQRIEPLLQAKTLIDDVTYDLREYSRDLNGDSNDLDQLEERLSQVRKLQKKFGDSIPQILEELSAMEGEMQKLSSVESRISEIHSEVEVNAKTLAQLAQKLHKQRADGAKKLSNAVNVELKDLNMKGVLFGIEVGTLPDFGPLGISQVQFTIQSSPKDEPRPIGKVASGGELSRILLSLKRVIGQAEQPRTYLFDEVDTGVSGVTAEKVGRKLKEIARGQQVVCVTHLAQVAAFADHHFRIEKSSGKGGATMSVGELDASARVEEVARLISGEKISKTSRDHARELIRECQT